MDLGGFGRFRGPPKSTLALQNESFYEGASTILKKSCFKITTSMFEQIMFLYNCGTLQHHLKITPQAVPLLDKILFGSENVPENHHALKNEVPELQKGAQSLQTRSPKHAK